MKNVSLPITIINKYRLEIMGFSALWIAFFHFWDPYLYKLDINFISEIIWFLKRIGYVGVDIFLFLSAIGLSRSLERNSISKYFINRIKRVYIPFIIFIFIVVFIRRYSLNYSLNFIFRECTFYTFFFEYIYNTAWYIPCIMFMYLLFPIYKSIIDKHKDNGIWIYISSLCIWGIIAIAGRYHFREDLYGLINRIPIFITGIFVSHLIAEKKMKLNTISLCSLAAILSLGFYLMRITFYASEYNHIIPGIESLFIGFVALPLVFILSFIFTSIDAISQHKSIMLKILKFYGKISLEFYLFQELLSKNDLPQIYFKFLEMTPINFKNVYILIVGTLFAYLFNTIYTFLLRAFRHD